jgi:hypothetical protein
VELVDQVHLEQQIVAMVAMELQSMPALLLDKLGDQV